MKAYAYTYTGLRRATHKPTQANADQCIELSKPTHRRIHAYADLCIELYKPTNT